MFTLSNWIDRFDPYWYSRLISIKFTYVGIVFFIVNGFVFAPTFPTMPMLITGVGILFIELPKINDFKTKDILYFIYLVLAVLTMSIFNLFSYFLLGFILAALWCGYIMYSTFIKKPEMLEVVSIIIVLALMSIEGQTVTDLYSVYNQALFYLEFGLAAFWAHKFFPNLYSNTYRSSILRLLETNLRIVESGSYDANTTRIISQHYFAMYNVLPLLRAKEYAVFTVNFTNQLNEFQSWLLHEIDTKSDSIEFLPSFFHSMIISVKQLDLINQEDHLPKEINKLIKNWNDLCKRI
ncbi:MAG: hypothetical protein AB8B67_03175 [Rickettsiaceae bacterium]